MLWKYIKKILKTALIVVCSMVLLREVFFFGFIKWYTYEGEIVNERGLHSQKFSTEKWKEPFPLRSEMYYDLVENYIHIGMPLCELDKLLGPTPGRRIYDSKSYHSICLQYMLGPLLSGLHHTDFYLVICPDVSGEKVEKIVLIGGKYKDFDNGKRAIIDENGSLKEY